MPSRLSSTRPMVNATSPPALRNRQSAWVLQPSLVSTRATSPESVRTVSITHPPEDAQRAEVALRFGRPGPSRRARPAWKSSSRRMVAGPGLDVERVAHAARPSRARRDRRCRGARAPRPNGRRRACRRRRRVGRRLARRGERNEQDRQRQETPKPQTHSSHGGSERYHAIRAGRPRWRGSGRG